MFLYIKYIMMDTTHVYIYVFHVIALPSHTNKSRFSRDKPFKLISI